MLIRTDNNGYQNVRTALVWIALAAVILVGGLLIFLRAQGSPADFLRDVIRNGDRTVEVSGGPISSGELGGASWSEPAWFHVDGIFLFGVLFVLAGLAGKVLGCSGTALLCRYRPKDALRIGIGMMARAEVALVCMTKGIDSGLIDPSIAIFVVVLIVVSSFVTPIVLRSSYKGEEAVTDAPGA